MTALKLIVAFQLFSCIAGLTGEAGNKLNQDLKSKKDGIDLQYSSYSSYSSPTAPPTQYVEWYKTSPQYGGAYKGLATSGTGQYVIFYSSSQGLQYSKNYGVNSDICTNSATYSTMNNYVFTSLKMSSSGQNAAALGSYVGIALSYDYGHRWTLSYALSSSVQWQALAISADMQYIYALQPYAQFAYSTDSGNTFVYSSSTSFPLSQALYDIACSANGENLVVANAQLIYYSSDFGATWTPGSVGINQPYLALTMDASGMNVAAIAQYQVITSSDGGANFITTNAPSIYAFNAIASDASGANLIVGTNANGIYWSTDFGVNWELSTAPITNYASVALSNTSDHVYASSNPNGVYYYVGPPAPTNWVAATTSGMTTLNSVGWSGIVASDSGQYVVSYTYNGGPIFYSNDYGTSYTQSNANSYTYTNDMVVSSDGQTMIALQKTDGLLISYSAGVFWEQNSILPAPDTANYQVWQTIAASSNMQYIYAAKSPDTVIWMSDDFGDNFHNMTTYNVYGAVQSQYFADSGCSDDGMYVVFVSSSGAIYISSNFGMPFTQVYLYAVYTSVAVSASGQYMAASTADYNAQSIWLSTDYGVTWLPSSVATGESYVSVTMDSSGQYLAAIKYNLPVIQSSDFGVTWFTGDAPIINAYQWKSIASDASGAMLFAAQTYGGLYSELTGITASPTVYSVPTPAPSRPTRQPTAVPTVAPSGAPEYFPADTQGQTAWYSVVSSPSGQNVVGILSYGAPYYSNNYGRSYAAATLYNTMNTIADVVFGSAEQNVIGLQDYGSPALIVSGNYGKSYATPYTDNGLPNGIDWLAIAADSSLTYVHALASQSDAYYQSVNGGQTFTKMTIIVTDPMQMPAYYSDIACSSDGQYVYVVSSYNVIYMSNTYGASFVATNSPSSSWSAISTSGNGQYVTAGQYGALYVSSNFGADFAPVTLSSGQSVSDVYSISTTSSGQFIYAIVSNVPLLQSADYGVTWTVGNTPTISGLPASYWKTVSCDSTGANVYTAVYYSGLYFFSDNYTSPSPTTYSVPTPTPSIASDWVQANAPYNSYGGISVSQSGQFAVAYGQYGTGMFISNDFGYSFGYTNADNYAGWRGVVMTSDASTMFALSMYYGLYTSTNYGNSWTKTNHLPLYNYPNCIAASSDLQYVYVGATNGGDLFLSSDFGANYSSPTIMSQDGFSVSTWYTITCSQSGQYIAAASYSYVFTSNDYGDNWVQSTFASASNNQVFTSIVSSASGQYMYGVSMNYYQTVYVSSDYGVSWSSAQNSVGSYYWSITCDSTGMYVSAATSGGSVSVWKSADFGATWVDANAPCPNGYCSFNAISSDAVGDLVMTTTSNANSIYYHKDNTITASPTVYSVPTPAPSRPTRQPTMRPSQYPTNISYPSEYPTQPPVIPADWYQSNGSYGNWNGIVTSQSGQYIIAYSGGGSCLKYSTNYGAVYKQSNVYCESFYGAVISNINGQVFAISSYSGLFTSTDYGASFVSSSALPSNGGYRAIAASSDLQYVFIASSGASPRYVSYSTNYGLDFALSTVTTSSSYGLYLQTITCSANGQYVVTGENGGNLYLSSDYGLNFAVTGNYVSSGWVGLAASQTGQYFYAVGSGSYGIYNSSDYGVTWSNYNSPYSLYSYNSIATSASGQTIYAAAQNLPIVISNDFGESYSFANAYQSYYGFIYNGLATDSTGQIAYASTNYNGLYLHNPEISAPTLQPTPYVAPTSIPTTGPNSWYPSDTYLGYKGFTGVATCQSGQNVVAYTNYQNGMYYSSDGGINYKKSDAQGLYWYSVVFGSTGANALAIDGSTGLWVSANGGKNWTQGFADNTVWWSAMGASQDLQYVYMGAQGGYFMRSDNGGMSFNDIDANVTDDSWYSLSTSYSGQFVLGTIYSEIRVSTDYGVTWMGSNLPSGWGYQTGTVSSSGQYMTVGTSYSGNSNCGIYISSDYGLTWQQASGVGYDYGINSIAGDASGQFLVAVQSGTPILQSNDFGVTWFSGEAAIQNAYNWEAVASDATGDRLYSVIYDSSPQYKVNAVPTQFPTSAPVTERPSREPTWSVMPTEVPTERPTTTAPSESPSMRPSATPSIAPSEVPSVWPTLRPSESPSQIPTPLPSFTPTELPSNAPVAPGDPTEAPVTPAPTVLPTTATPSQLPTTLLPTVAPTTVPTTNMPSAAPTVGPTTLMPSVMPVVATTTVPTALPSVTRAPTVFHAPTVAPFRQPSVSPTTAGERSPTVAPSVVPTVAAVSFYATQTVVGLTVTQYYQQVSANSLAIAQTASDVMTDIDPEDISGIVATYPVSSSAKVEKESTESSQHLRRALQTTTDSILVSYLVTTNVPGVSYSSLTNELSTAVESGTFTTLMNQNAAALGATDLTTASSTSVSTVNNVPSSSLNDDEESQLSGGAIAGIVIALIVFFAFVAAVVIYFNRQMSTANTSSKASNVMAAMNDMEMQDKSGGSSAVESTANPILSAKHSSASAPQPAEEAAEEDDDSETNAYEDAINPMAAAAAAVAEPIPDGK